MHAFLDNLKAPISLVARRVDYYRLLLTSVLRSLRLPLHLLTFVVGSSYQYSQEYNTDKYKLCAITTEHDARKAGAEVVKQVTSPLLSGLLYPLLQALDEEYLKVDFQFGGVDQASFSFVAGSSVHHSLTSLSYNIMQRKIFTYAEASLPKLGYAKRAHLMNSMVPGLSGGKMSSSDPNSKIDFLDSPATVKSKIAKAHCAPGEVEGNGVLAFVRHVVAPIGELMKGQGRPEDRIWAGELTAVFTVSGDPKHGGTIQHFSSVDDLEKAYAANEIHPGDLKAAVVAAINALLKPIQQDFESNPEFKEMEALAYPAEVKEVKKKEKKVSVKPDHVIAREKAQREAKANEAVGALGETAALNESLP